MKKPQFYLNTVVLACACLTGCASLDSSSQVMSSAPHRIEFAQPSPTLWSKMTTGDAGGYLVTYTRKDSTRQRIEINYGRGLHSSQEDTMQQVKNAEAMADCQRNDFSVISSDKYALVFKTIQDKCSTGKSLTQVYKVFNLSDGQYSIIYAANPTRVSPGTIYGMTEMVKDATIVKNN